MGKAVSAVASAVLTVRGVCRDLLRSQACLDLHNQIDRTYEAEMDFTLAKLKRLGPGNGVSAPPDIGICGFPVQAAKKKTGSREIGGFRFPIGIGAFAYFFA